MTVHGLRQGLPLLEGRLLSAKFGCANAVQGNVMFQGFSLRTYLPLRKVYNPMVVQTCNFYGEEVPWTKHAEMFEV